MPMYDFYLLYAPSSSGIDAKILVENFCAAAGAASRKSMRATLVDYIGTSKNGHETYEIASGSSPRMGDLHLSNIPYGIHIRFDSPIPKKEFDEISRHYARKISEQNGH